MKRITMTPEQTERYDDDDDFVMEELLEQAYEIRTGTETVEIYTSDGILAEMVQEGDREDE